MYVDSQRVAIVNYTTYYCIGQGDGSIPVQIFANAFVFVHVIVTTIDHGVDVGNKVKIRVEYNTQITGSWWGKCYCHAQVLESWIISHCENKYYH